jgi:hypothetical protein
MAANIEEAARLRGFMGDLGVMEERRRFANNIQGDLE